MPKAEKKREEQEQARKAAEEAAKLVDIRSQLKGFDARAWFIETLKYVSWVVVFTMSIFANRGTANQYNYVDLWRAQARAGIPDPFATGEHFWEMISGENGLLKMLGPAALVERNEDGNATGFFTYPSSEGDYGLAYKSPLGANETITRLAWNGNVIVDGIWLRQLRISSINCTKFGKLAQVSMPCFPAWDSDDEEKFYAKLTRINPGDCCYSNSNETYGDEYEYRTADKTNFTTYRRGLNRYHGGGFIARLNDPNVAGDFVQLLQDNRWIDLKTRMIFTAFCVFNLNNQLFLCMHITVEVDDLGKFTIDQRYFPVNLDAYDFSNPSTFLKLGLQGYVAFWVFYYIVEEGRQMKQMGFRAYFSEIWNCIDVMNLILFLIAGFLQYQAVTLLRSMSADPNLVSTPKLLATGDYTDSYTMINSVNALVMWFKIFKYISITKRLTRIAKALFKALPDVGAFFFVFIILFIGFGISAHLLFGNDIARFSSVGESFLTLFRMMLGDWDYDAIMLSAPIMGPVWFILWIVCSAIILLNFIVGVLGESYNDVVEEEQQDNKLDVLDIIAVKAKQGIGIAVDLAAIAGIEQRIDNADASGDGNVDLAELQKLMGEVDLSSAFPGKSAAEIMAIFDKDGNGVLDKDEIAAFKSHWKRAATGSGPAPPNAGDSSGNANATLEKPKEEVAAVPPAAGCGGPGGFCCCRCGCPKGGSAPGERRAMERVELTLLRLESIMKDKVRDDDQSAAFTSLLEVGDDDSAVAPLTGVPSAAAAKLSMKRNSVAPI